MGKNLTVVTNDGRVNMMAIGKLIFLLILSSLALLTALAMNETVQKFLEHCHIRKDNLFGYVIYTFVTLGILITVAYIGCTMSPELVEYINISPLK